MTKYSDIEKDSPIGFTLPASTDSLFSELRSLANIGIQDSDVELNNAMKILSFTHRLFDHDGDNSPSSVSPAAILKEALAGESFRCLEYSLLASALLQAYGIPARTIGLKTEDVEIREYGAGHVVVEFWDPDQRKWAMCDVQAGVIPVSKNTGEMMSALEFAESDAAGLKQIEGSKLIDRFKSVGDYMAWVEEYLYYIDTPIDVRFDARDLRLEKLAMLIPDGAREPKVFQNSFDMNLQYVRSRSGFYAPPKLPA